MEGQTETIATAGAPPPPVVENATQTAQTSDAAQTNGAAQTNDQTTQATNGAAQAETAKPYWPENWRERMAEHASAGDKKAYDKELARLQRITNPEGIYGSYRSMENTWASKKFVKLPGDDAKPEEIAEYRKSMGVPDTPDDYLKNVKLENGAIIGDADKPVIGEFVTAMHKAGAPQGVVNEALNWYYKSQELQAAALDESDDKFRVEQTRDLKEELGPRYNRIINSIQTVFKGAPGGADSKNPNSLFSRIMAGRTADGKIIGNDASVVRWLASLAQDINPEATVVDDADGRGLSMEAEISEIEKVMRTDRPLYNKKYATRYAELLGAREKSRARAR